MCPEAAPAVVDLDLPCDERAPGLARDALRQLPEIDSVRNDVLMVASELVSNAVIHSGCGGGDLVHIDASCAGRRLRIAVHDQGRSWPAPELDRNPVRLQIGGFGLRLVQQLSLRWGVDSASGGNVVWAELAL